MRVTLTIDGVRGEQLRTVLLAHRAAVVADGRSMTDTGPNVKLEGPECFTVSTAPLHEAGFAAFSASLHSRTAAHSIIDRESTIERL
jgi:hypothetical protein